MLFVKATYPHNSVCIRAPEKAEVKIVKYCVSRIYKVGLTLPFVIKLYSA